MAVGIDKAREAYRITAKIGALVYFIVDNLWILDHMYQYSMENFVMIFIKGMTRAKEKEELEQRVEELNAGTMWEVFQYISQGLFVRHKLIFSTQLAFQLLKKTKVEGFELDEQTFKFLVYGPQPIENPLEFPVPTAAKDWLTESSWHAVQSLIELEPYIKLPEAMLDGKRFREWSDSEAPEEHPLPHPDFKKMVGIDKLCVIRCLRPDRMTEATSQFVASVLGKRS